MPVVEAFRKGVIMAARKSRASRGFDRHVKVIHVLLAVSVFLVVVRTIIVGIFTTVESGTVPDTVFFLAVVVLILALIATLAQVRSVLDATRRNGARLEQIAEDLDNNRTVLKQITQSIRLSEATREMVFRDADKQTLREAVFDRLQQKDYEATEKMITEIARRPEYEELARQLRTEVANYKNASHAERINHVIRHIERLLDDHEWTKASMRIERLIRDNPNSETVKALRQKLIDRKQERKKILLTAWDDAIKRQDTDRSIDILRELDMYLTANEGLALREAAKDVFKTKLHNLGVQFSLDVSEQNWSKALQCGQHIVKGFPNSRMAQEIREKWNILEQKAANQGG